ncbi:MAG: arginyl-tRNA synthetase [Chitinophagaceae bacterium]|nr:arginyl-tRNA synthetase [Chitinophagaceae bacterium]
MEKKIAHAIQSYFTTQHQITVPEAQLALQETKKEFEGDLTFVLFPFLKATGKKPEDLGAALGSYLIANVPGITSFNIVKGFLNLVLANSYWNQLLSDFYTNGIPKPMQGLGKKVMVEYSSPNTNKPLHLGHLRNNFLGYSIAEILKACGYNVVKANLVNDRGIHICKSMIAYQKEGNGETPQSSGLKGDHLVGKYYVLFDAAYRKEIKALMEEGKTEDEAKKKAPIMLAAQDMLLRWETGDPETIKLWKTMNGWVYEGFDQTYRNIGVDFDKMYYESDTYLLGKTTVEEGLKAGVFFKKEDGSVWIDLTAEGLDQKLVLRGDGTSVYITQDMGTADLKYKEFNMDRSIYVVGNEQDYHFVVLKHILKKLGRPYAEGIYHLSYGMVDLPSGRMKSREGTVVDADDLVQEMITTAEARTRELGKIEDFSSDEANKLYRMLGLGALKYFLLKVDPKKSMLFNPDESVEFQGNTGPFIQYTHARISAILRKATQLKVLPSAADIQLDYVVHEAERNVLALLKDFPVKTEEAAETYSPALVANYVYALAKEFNRMYNELAIIGHNTPAEQAYRLILCTLTKRTIREAMLFVGIEVPEKM